MSVEDYNGGCPLCGDSADGHDEPAGMNMIKQHCTCNGCEAEFIVTYKVIDVEVIEEDELECSIS